MCTAPSDHREDGGGAVTGVAHELLMQFALRGVAERSVVGQVVHDARRAAGDRAGDRMRAEEVERQIPAHPFDAFGDREVDRGGDGVADRSVAVEQIDYAQLGELWDSGASEVAQRHGGVERSVERPRRVDQEFQPVAMLAQAVEREVDDDRRQQREHDPDAGDGAEGAGDVFVGERQQKCDERGEGDEDEAHARLEGGRVPDCEQVDQRERAAGAAAGGAQHGDQDDAP